jgi:hypothetical protein
MDHVSLESGHLSTIVQLYSSLAVVTEYPTTAVNLNNVSRPRKLTPKQDE